MRSVALLILSISSLYLFAQTPIEGIINDYARVDFIDYCDGKIATSDAGQFESGDQIIVIQMQGAVINENNGANFGNINNPRSAGLYEVATIDRKIGDTLIVESYLINEYDLDGSIQIVSYPKYNNALIANELTAKSWDGETGGVLAFSVENDLTFNADINVDGKGFRGGQSISLVNDCSGALNNASLYFYAESNWRGAQKGEGIAKKITNKESGKGAQATGGGGGNDHNAGGGGGANISTGGRGGDRITSFFTGDCKGDNPGIGGKFITRDEKRIFMGGGGGAGHANNNFGTDGGNGGGIVILDVGNDVTGNFSINANGINVQDIAAGDGAGGGGAGGTVVVNSRFVLNSIDINAIGGKGGDADNDFSNTCFGPGGGGSGGYIFTNRSANVENVNGGANGLSIKSGRGNCGDNDAEPGSNGFVSNDLSELPTGNILITGPSWVTQPQQAVLMCDGDDLMLMGVADGPNITYQWQVFDGTNWVNLNDSGNVSGTQTGTLNIDMIAGEGVERYRLVVTDDCGKELISNVATVTIQSNVEANFSYVINGGEVQFTNLSTNATSYLWEFGDGNSSVNSDPTYTYVTNGDFVVTLRVSGPCGIDDYTETITVNNILNPTADFSSNVTEGCEPLTVGFQNLSNNGSDFLWTFQGGNPSNSTDENPIVIYDTEGVYTVKLVVRNAVGADSIEQVDYITVLSKPAVSFTYNPNDLEVTFINSTTGATDYLWEFGDGNTSIVEAPTHTYSADGLYDVKLTATNQCGESSASITISLGGPPVADFGAVETIGCAPFTVQYENRSSPNSTSFSWFFPGGNPANSTDENPVVTYNIPGNYTALLAVENALGVDTIRKIDFITVQNTPTADFTFMTDGRLFQFENTSTNADTYSWDFGDGNSSSSENPNHTYIMNGDYTVSLTVSNDCGEDTYTQTITAGGPPAAIFENNLSNGCAPLTVTFTDISIGEVTNRMWIFPGGDVTTSINETVRVNYFNPGVYDVILVVENAFGKDSLVKEDLIEVQPRPFAGFNFDINGLEVDFTNASTSATTYLWDFGDGGNSFEENPMHTFPSTGDYIVNLIAANDFCNSSISITVSITTNSAKEITTESGVKVFPNPVSNTLKVELDTELTQSVESFTIIDVTGKVVGQESRVSLLNQIDVSHLASGIYLLKIHTNEEQDLISRFVKE